MFGFSLIEELRQYGVQVTVCELGVIDTDFAANSGVPASSMTKMNWKDPAHRVATASLEDFRVGKVLSYGTLPRTLVKAVLALVSRERLATMVAGYTRRVVFKT